MTKIQYKFLKAIRETDKSAEEICKELKIQSCEKNQPEDIGGYYNALNRSIGYLVSDQPGEIDDCFEIKQDQLVYSNRDRYFITKEGRTRFDAVKSEHTKLFLSILGLLIALIGLVLKFIFD